MNEARGRTGTHDLNAEHRGLPPRGTGFAGVAVKLLDGVYPPEYRWPQACSADGRLRLAIHGDLCNARDLGRRLDLREHLPQHEIMLAAWERWGADALAQADGVFALALMDGDELSLFCDRSGLGRLYYYTGQPGQVAFSTHLDALLGLPGTGRRIARRSLHEYLRFGDIAAPNTLFEDVFSVEAGQLLRWSGGKLERDLPVARANRAPPPTQLDAAVEALGEHLRHAIGVRLEDASRPAAFLSGGVDSTLICALAARERRDLVAVTVGFAGADDEAPLAQRIAGHLGLRHETLRFGHEALVAAFERLAQVMDQPTADPATPATVLAFDHCHQRYDVVLDGTGADEAVGALPPRHVRVAVQFSSLLPPSVRHTLAKLLRGVPALGPYTPLIDFEHPADTMVRWHGFTRSEIESLCGEPVSFEHTQFYRTFARFPRSAHFERYSALIDAMPCERLTQAMRASAATVRYPFCDRDTDRFLRQLPPALRALPGEPKRILRALLARYVPCEIWDQPKHGFNFPLTEFLMTRNFELVRRHLLDSDIWQRTGLLSADGVRRHAARFIAGDRYLVFRVWRLTVLGAWLEKHPKARSS